MTEELNATGSTQGKIYGATTDVDCRESCFLGGKVLLIGRKLSGGDVDNFCPATNEINSQGGGFGLVELGLEKFKHQSAIAQCNSVC